MEKDQTKKDTLTRGKVDILAEDRLKPALLPKVKKEGKEILAVQAKARYLRISPKKVRLVIDLIRGQKVTEALVQLKFLNKEAARLVSQLLNSAVANAEHNFKLKKVDLYIKQIVANQGPTLHRWRPVAYGRAHPIRKRSTHLEVVLGLPEEKVMGREKKKRGLLPEKATGKRRAAVANQVKKQKVKITKKAKKVINKEEMI